MLKDFSQIKYPTNPIIHTHWQVARTIPQPKPAKEYSCSHRTDERTNMNAETRRRKMHEN